MWRLECLSENPVALRAGCSGAGCRLWKRSGQSALYAGVFCDMTAQRAEALAQTESGASIEASWISEDVRVDRRSQKWLNVIFRRG